MARVAFPLVLQSPSTGSAISGATATVTQHVVGSTPGTGPAAAIYASETGGSSIGDQIITDNLGRFTQGQASGYAQYWLAQGTYDITVSGAGLTSYTITRELFSAGQSDEVGLVGELKFWPGLTLPPGFDWADGGQLSRTTYQALFNQLALQTTGNLNSSTTVSSIPPSAITTLQQITNGLTSGLAIPISGPNIPAGATVTAYNAGAATLTLSAPAQATSTGVALVIAPHGVGNGTTTFHKPNMTQRSPLGQATSGVGQVLGQTGGEVTHQLLEAELAQHNHGGQTGTGTSGSATIPAHNHGGQTGTGSTGSVTIAPHNHGGAAYNAGAWQPRHDQIQVGAADQVYANAGYNAAAAFGQNQDQFTIDSDGGSTHAHLVPALSISSDGGGSHAHLVPALVISSDGGGQAHNNMHPWLAAPYIIRHGVQ